MVPRHQGVRPHRRRLGAKRLLRIATEGGADKDGVVPILAKILQMPFLSHTDFIASSLWPNNLSLHPPILYGLFKDWDGKTAYKPKTSRPSFMPTCAPNRPRRWCRWTRTGLDRQEARAALPNNQHLKSDFLYHCVNENYLEQIMQVRHRHLGAHQSRLQQAQDPLHHRRWRYRADSQAQVLRDRPAFGLCTFVDIARMIDVKTPRSTR